MATKNYKIEIDKGWFMSWFVTTQTSLKIAVTLKDEKKVYFSETKQNPNINPPLNTGYGFIEGNHLEMMIESNGPHLLGTPHSNDILTDEGIIVGKEFNLCIEDCGDNDYNDVSVSIVAWKHKG